MSSRMAASGLRPCCCRHAWWECMVGAGLGVRGPWQTRVGVGRFACLQVRLILGAKDGRILLRQGRHSPRWPRRGRRRRRRPGRRCGCRGVTGLGGGGGGGRVRVAGLLGCRVACWCSSGNCANCWSRRGQQLVLEALPCAEKASRVRHVMSCYHMPRLARRCARHCRPSHRSPTYYRSPTYHHRSSMHRDGASAQLTLHIHLPAHLRQRPPGRAPRTPPPPSSRRAGRPGARPAA